MKAALISQIAQKDHEFLANGWTSNFRHFERWLKCKGWTDEVYTVEILPISNIANTQDSFLNKLTDRSWVGD